MKLSPLPAAEVSVGEEEDEESARLQFKAFMHREQFKAVLRIRIHMFLGLLDPDPIVRGMDPDSDPALDPDLDPSIIMQIQ